MDRILKHEHNWEEFNKCEFIITDNPLRDMD